MQSATKETKSSRSRRCTRLSVTHADTSVSVQNDFSGKDDAPMAQLWPVASRLARDARMPCAPARGAP
eukprot:6142656-Prymnesium_polylepis.1